jgi:uridylate kinase
MQKATTDDIGAICSRIDAQTVIMIEMLSEVYFSNPDRVSAKYRTKYDKLAEKFRKGLVE